MAGKLLELDNFVKGDLGSEIRCILCTRFYRGSNGFQDGLQFIVKFLLRLRETTANFASGHRPAFASDDGFPSVRNFRSTLVLVCSMTLMYFYSYSPPYMGESR